MTYTEFFDPRSTLMAPARYIYIAAKEQDARKIFKERFDLDPDRFQVWQVHKPSKFDDGSVLIIE